MIYFSSIYIIKIIEQSYHLSCTLQSVKAKKLNMYNTYSNNSYHNLIQSRIITAAWKQKHLDASTFGHKQQ